MDNAGTERNALSGRRFFSFVSDGKSIKLNSLEVGETSTKPKKGRPVVVYFRLLSYNSFARQQSDLPSDLMRVLLVLACLLISPDSYQFFIPGL